MASEPFFRAAVAALLVAFVLDRGHHNRRLPAARAETIERRPVGLSTRVAEVLSVVALFATVAYVAFPAAVSWASAQLPTWLRWLGLGVAALGFGLLEWSHAALGRNWSDEPRIIRGQVLVTAGPYRWIRHPIYAAFLLILGSTFLVAASWLVGGLWTLAAAIDVAGRIAYEEEAMLRQFGPDYCAYRATTGALLPPIGRRSPRTPL